MTGPNSANERGGCGSGAGAEVGLVTWRNGRLMKGEQERKTDLACC